MSEENVENLRAFLLQNPVGEQDLDLSLLDPDVAFEDTVLPSHVLETYRGHEGVVRAIRAWLEDFEEFTIELEEIVGTGDRLVSIHSFRGKARYSGIELTLRFAYLWTFRNGKVIRFVSFRDPAEAHEAAGASE